MKYNGSLTCEKKKSPKANIFEPDQPALTAGYNFTDAMDFLSRSMFYSFLQKRVERGRYAKLIRAVLCERGS